ncbi:hypothetical protein AAVH_38524 [Aphelenchoides avenae]|nr:hypothetical protein AAVH_38524 [Aphelenchus avenae]
MNGSGGPPFPQRNYGGPGPGSSRHFYNRQITFNGPSQAHAQRPPAYHPPPAIGPPLYVNYTPQIVRPLPPVHAQPQIARPPTPAVQPFHARPPIRSGELHWVPLIDFIVWYLGEDHDVARAQFADYPSVRDEIFERLHWPQRLRSVMENSVAELGNARRFARGPDDRFQLVATFRDGPDRPSFFPLQNLRIGLDFPLNKLMFEGRRPFRRHRRNQPGHEVGVQTDNCDTSSRSAQTDCDENLSDFDEDQYGFSYDADVDTADEDRRSGDHLSPPATAMDDRELSPASAELGKELSPAHAESESDRLSEASEAFQPEAETRPRSHSAGASVNLARMPHCAQELFVLAARRRKPTDTGSTCPAPPSKKADTSRALDAASHGEARDEADRIDTYSPEL